MLEYSFTFTEQDLYDNLIQLLNEKVKNKENREKIIAAIDKLIAEIMDGDY